MKNGIYQYHPELGELKPECQMSARYNSFIGKWAIRTILELKGQGIKFYEIDSQNRNFYYVSPKAFDKLSMKYTISQELLFN